MTARWTANTAMMTTLRTMMRCANHCGDFRGTLVAAACLAEPFARRSQGVQPAGVSEARFLVEPEVAEDFDGLAQVPITLLRFQGSAST
jgi:hypothetical protein